jgi:LuxR family maltose regulon positive regulatory protein
LRGIASLWQGDFDRAYGLVHDSLAMLDERELFWRSSDLIVVGNEELNAGRMQSAEEVLIEARALAGASQNPHGQLAATHLLADAYLQEGEFEQARQLYEQVRAEAAGSDDMLDDQAAAALGLGTIARERNHLDAAEREASRALELGRQRSNEHVIVRAGVLLGRVLQAKGQGVQARERLVAQLAETSHPILIRELLTAKARLELAAGDIDAARRWYAGIAPHTPGRDAPNPIPLVLHEQQDLVAARLLVANGDSATAVTLLERWRDDAQLNGRMTNELQASLLMAVAREAQSEQALAGTVLARALVLAERKGYLRTILDEGEPVRHLLSEHRSQVERAAPRLRAYLYRLLAAFATDTGGTAPASEIAGAGGPTLFEPLSIQEQRVLRLLAAGLSNPEIARELVVSTNTIKTQVQSIYRKLNVNNRAEAGEVAHALRLV